MFLLATPNRGRTSYSSVVVIRTVHKCQFSCSKHMVGLQSFKCLKPPAALPREWKENRYVVCFLGIT